MARRTGIWTINLVAKNLCRLVTKFSPVIAATFPTNAPLIAALAAANAACAALVLETQGEFIYGD